MNFDTLENTKERLENWKRAFISHPHYRVTASLEGRYKSPQHWDAPQAKIDIDINDALSVERVVIKLPALHKAILKYNYFTPFIPLQVFCRKNNLAARHFESELSTSIRMVDNLLRK